MARKVSTFTPGAGVGGFGGSPPFEEATTTPGAGVGGFGGVPPFEGATNNREGTGYAVACPLHVYLICFPFMD